MVGTVVAPMTARSSTLQKVAIFCFISRLRERSERHSRMSAWIPMESSSLTECWVGLVFSSCAAAIQGTSVRWMKTVFSRPSSWRIWRMASRNGSDSMSPTVPPISTMVTSAPFDETLRMAFLISLVTWGITWTVLPR